MQVESLDENVRAQIYKLHKDTTKSALAQLFDKSDLEATKLVEELWSRYLDAPQSERDMLLHNDPAALACDLAGVEWTAISQERLKKFNETRRPTMEALRIFLTGGA
jgi:hypothetical protein